MTSGTFQRCAGSGQIPHAKVMRVGQRVEGLCGRCHRWLFLVKRRETLPRHAPYDRAVEADRLNWPRGRSPGIG